MSLPSTLPPTVPQHAAPPHPKPGLHRRRGRNQQQHPHARPPGMDEVWNLPSITSSHTASRWGHPHLVSPYSIAHPADEHHLSFLGPAVPLRPTFLLDPSPPTALLDPSLAGSVAYPAPQGKAAAPPPAADAGGHSDAAEVREEMGWGGGSIDLCADAGGHYDAAVVHGMPHCSVCDRLGLLMCAGGGVP